MPHATPSRIELGKLRRASPVTRPPGAALLVALTLGALALVSSPLAAATTLPPTTIEGPSTEGLGLEDVAMAPDGTGGLLYTKLAGGAPHLFASRYDGERWSAPVRVDWDIPYDASQGRLAAAPGGRLLAVWVTQTGTVAGQIRRGLYSATLGPRSDDFGPSLLVDANVGEGGGVDPSLAGAVPGRAIVAYRVVTHRFLFSEGFTTARQLRPGDVMAEIRVARLEGDRWSRLGPVNRYPEASMRPPTASNGPRVAVGATGRAVVVWQEPELDGVARVWMRRVFGTNAGPVLAASPDRWEGRPVADDATAFALDATAFDQVRVAVRIDGGPRSPIGGQRLFLVTLGPEFTAAGAQPSAPALADGSAPPPPPLGPPAIAASDDGGGGEGSFLLAFAAGNGLRRTGVDATGQLSVADAPGPAAKPAGEVVAAVDPDGGGAIAYEGFDGEGIPGVVVREDPAGGGSQTGLLFGPLGGSTSQLSGSGSGAGDMLLAFRQGDSGRFAIVATAVLGGPGGFNLEVPARWVPPKRAKVRWPPAPSLAAPVSYDLLVDGRPARVGMVRRQARPRPAQLGSGVRRVQVMAADRLGQRALSRPAKLRVDGERPRLRVRLRPRANGVVLELSDAHSGLRAAATRVRFGDGERARRGKKVRHSYDSPGRYLIRLRARDRAGNRLVRRVPVMVR